MKLHSRIGRTMSLPAMNNKSPQAIQTNRDSSLAVHGAKLFNCLPRSIRDVTKCATLEFKATLDKFLSSIPDKPLVTGYTQLRSADSNSLISLVLRIPPFCRGFLAPKWTLSKSPAPRCHAHVSTASGNFIRFTQIV